MHCARPFKGAKATPKKLEKELLDKSRQLAEDPSLLLPERLDGSWRCKFGGYLRKMEKVARYRDDPERLKSMASHGKQLVRAYAATLSLAAAGKIPFVATTSLPHGEVSYAVRGKVDKEKLVGVQHFDDPDLRLLAYMDLAKKKNFHIYSAPSGLYCSKRPDAPRDYVEEMVRISPYELDSGGKCSHGDTGTGLSLLWQSPDRDFFVCSDCLKDVNLAKHLSSRIAARDPLDDFRIDVKHEFDCRGECDTCLTNDITRLSSKLVEEYFAGKLSDRELCSQYLENKLHGLRQSGKLLYVLGNRCFGQDKQALVKELKGDALAKETISWLLDTREVPIINDTNEANSILNDLWNEHGFDILANIASKSVAKEVIKRDDLTPSKKLEEAKRRLEARQIKSALPEYSSLGEIGEMADKLARTYKVEGKEAMIRMIENESWRGYRNRSVAYAFLSAVQKGEGKSWQFTKEEEDFGQYLSQFAEKVLQADGEEYHDAFRLLIEASGAGEDIVRK